jgi:hypothetical protein
MTLTALVAWLAALNPSLPWLLLSAIVFAVIYGARKWFPVQWELFAEATPLAMFDPVGVVKALNKVWQSLPAAALGAVTMLMQGGDQKTVLLGALAGLLAPVAHELMRAIPWIPYQGQTLPKVKK